MTLFIIILVIIAVIWLMLFKTKKEVQSLSQKPAETSIAKVPFGTEAKDEGKPQGGQTSSPMPSPPPMPQAPQAPPPPI